MAARRRGRRCLPAGDPSSSTISTVTAATRAMAPSFSGGGEEHSRGGALRRAARGSVGRCGGDSRAQEPRGTHGRAGVAWRNEVRFGRGAWSRVLAQVRVCCAWGGADAAASRAGGRAEVRGSRLGGVEWLGEAKCASSEGGEGALGCWERRRTARGRHAHCAALPRRAPPPGKGCSVAPQWEGRDRSPRTPRPPCQSW